MLLQSKAQCVVSYRAQHTPREGTHTEEEEGAREGKMYI